ncbi:exodeoxyribonuclease I [Pasteurellaceae bacterium HPA106]|uniref:exodeoxyribonuclease I n=1 Tax=Spirabiliibacterium pneumoniae TaxID=221400 RepID=UPI001AAD367A|nr:exodeoxyribonuclease I [Spirabiliibacterium pneumoniae]MBE2896496.1 exodeoxyribonuclease I [Spirabiliibacterium pneumoniae]
MMAEQTFFFYDYESFGVDPARDRPAQFAGIRTDGDFNPIGEPVMFYCKQTNDYLPQPEAVLITGITPQKCNQAGLDEPHFAEKILNEFSQPNTCILGYNNIRYDDEMTRYTFFRNFIDPYEYSWKNGNSRWDLLDLVRACFALRPEGINWVYDDNGLPSFRLELLTKANGIAHENAHDAMSDVYATIAMAKLIKAKQPRFFDYFFNLRHKSAVRELLELKNMTPLVHVSGMFGAARSNTSIIAPLAENPLNPNMIICCDLSADLEDLLYLDANTLRERLYTSKIQLEEQGINPVPLKGVHLNKCPILAPLNTLLPETAERLALDRDACLANWQKLRQSTEIRDKVADIFNVERTLAPDINVETALYAGFFSHADKNNLAILRSLSPEQLANHNLAFSDPRIPKLLFHYRARHHYSTLTRTEQLKWQKYRQQKLAQGIDDYALRLENLLNEYAEDNEKSQLLQHVLAHVQSVTRDI